MSTATCILRIVRQTRKGYAHLLMALSQRKTRCRQTTTSLHSSRQVLGAICTFGPCTTSSSPTQYDGTCQTPSPARLRNWSPYRCTMATGQVGRVSPCGPTLLNSLKTQPAFNPMSQLCFVRWRKGLDSSVRDGRNSGGEHEYDLCLQNQAGGGFVTGSPQESGSFFSSR